MQNVDPKPQLPLPSGEVALRQQGRRGCFTKKFELPAIISVTRPYYRQKGFPRKPDELAAAGVRHPLSPPAAAATEGFTLWYRPRISRWKRAGEAVSRGAGPGGIAGDHPELPWASLSNVARSYGVSLAYVSECVRAQTGKTYKELLQKHRMETAARLLRRSDLNIQQIITQVGYENTSYFYRLFHERYGQSPGSTAGHAASAHKRISERPSPPLQQALTERAVLCYIKAERSGWAAACRKREVG